jgi:transcriptional regulator with XRE-family HTH domain
MSYGVTINTEMLRAARLRKGWSLRDVSTRCEQLGRKVDHSNVARYERGELRPHPWTLQIVAQALDLDVDELTKAAA